MFKPLVTDEDIAAADEDIRLALEDIASVERDTRRFVEMYASGGGEEAPEVPHAGTGGGAEAQAEPDWDREFQEARVGFGDDVVEVRPEIKTSRSPVPKSARVKAMFGFRGALIRAETAARIARTIEFAFDNGVEDNQRLLGKDVAGALRSMSAAARDPKTPIRELDRILGWTQAAVCISCPGATMASVTAL